MEIAIWTDDTDTAFTRLVAAGARVLCEPHDWLGRLRVAWVADLDDNPIELVQRRARAGTASGRVRAGARPGRTAEAVRPGPQQVDQKMVTLYASAASRTGW